MYTFVSLSGWYISAFAPEKKCLHFLIRVFVTQINEMKTDEIDFCFQRSQTSARTEGKSGWYPDLV